MSESEMVRCDRCGKDYEATEEVASHLTCPYCQKHKKKTTQKLLDETLKLMKEKSGKNTDIH